MSPALAWSLALTVALGCDPDPNPGPGPTPTPAPSPEAAADPGPDSPADVLAHEVWRAAGGAHLDEVGQIDFVFVVEDAGSIVFEAAHRWDRRSGRDRVSWTDGEGVLRDAVVDLGSKRACGHVDGVAAEGEGADALAEAAYARWVNDAYWLMVPLKVRDAGVRRRLGGGEGDTRRLELTFEDVGLTPGDRYVLDVDPEGRVTRWEMTLQGSEPPPKGVTFGGHTAVGPLTLPLEHSVEGGERRVLLRDVGVHPDPVEATFAVRGCD